MALHPALPQVIKLRIAGESAERLFLVGQVNSPGVAGVKFFDFTAIFGGHYRRHAIGPASGGH
jgi:hypothetical protein